MDRQLINFINTLRKSDVRVSPAETMDAANAVALVGYEHRDLLHDTLSLVLAKTEQDKCLFDQCFERFFALNRFQAGSDENGQAGAAKSDGSGEGESTGGENDSSAAASGGEGPGYRQQAGQSSLGDENDDALQGAPEALSINIAAVLEQLAAAGIATDSGVLPALLRQDQVAVALQVQQATKAIGLEAIAYSTQRALYSYRILQALGIDDVMRATGILAAGNSEQQAAAALLQRAGQGLREYVNSLVEDQLLLYADAAGKELRQDILKQANLSRVEQRHFDSMQELVRKMAKKLAASHARRQRVQRRGQLDVARTIRRNIPNQGVLFDTYWKTRKKERPEIFAICDVSGSVSAYAKFLLLFLYSLSSVVPKTRAFAFSSRLGEVTELFQQQPVEKAIEVVNEQWGHGSTDYGQSLVDFAALALDDLRSNSTVIIIGDARNNNGDAQLPLLRSIYHRCQRLIWLNPEPRSFWGLGDSEMNRYLSCTHQADTCQSLQHLESIVSRILRVVD